jgi:hypothetical protein
MPAAMVSPETGTGQTDIYGRPTQPPTNNPLVNQYKLYNTAVGQQAQDYSGLMQGYKNLLSGVKTPQQIQSQSYSPQGYIPQTYTPQQIQATTSYKPQSYSPQQLSTPITQQYQQSGALSGAMGNLADLSQTGGYSPQDIADLRARGISPIRSIYASAQQNVDRQRALQGGYSPNYGAVSAKMARELSDQIGNQVTNINAGIAQNVAQNKLAIAPTYASEAAGQSNLSNQMGQTNAGIMNQANQFNTGQSNQANQYNIEQQNQGQLQNISNQMQLNQQNAGIVNQSNQANIDAINRANQANTDAMNQARQFNIQQPMQTAQFNTQQQQIPQQQQMQALQGMQGLYGTTPAMSQLFGNQALQGAQLQNQINQQNRQNTNQLINEGISLIPRFGNYQREAM